MIKVQQAVFNVGEELDRLKGNNTAVGASVAFVGTVREMSGHDSIAAMTLEHYPGMTEKALADIEQSARQRWPLLDCLIIHRYGTLQPGDDIVLVIVTSAHRQAAFDACAFLMDWLKTKAPFWKLEDKGNMAEWVEARDSDDEAAKRWQNGND